MFNYKEAMDYLKSLGKDKWIKYENLAPSFVIEIASTTYETENFDPVDGGPLHEEGEWADRWEERTTNKRRGKVKRLTIVE